MAYVLNMSEDAPTTLKLGFVFKDKRGVVSALLVDERVGRLWSVSSSHMVIY